MWPAPKCPTNARERDEDMIELTEEQFIEIIAEAVQRHISRDPTIATPDRAWENRNFVRTVASSLRQYGISVPKINPS
jgi:hypothetical protein